MTRVAVLGGGQLGRMLGLAGIPMGIEFAFLDPSAGAPAAAVGDLLVAGLDDEAAARKLAAGADVVTYEWEGVPAATARAAGAAVAVHPNPAVLEVAQDRVVEKNALRSLGIDTAEFRSVDTLAELEAAVAQLGLPAVLKTRGGGYDGKGQYVLRSTADIAVAWESLGGVPLVLEAFVTFRRELSIVAVRGRDGAVVCWPVVENVHREGILRVTRTPSLDADAALQARAEACIRPLLDSLDYVGVACVELFDTGDGLLANEIAPRVHNSGHWSIEGAQTSQFENHLRAVLGWPLGSAALRAPSAMVNCIGALPDKAAVLAIPGAHLHDYGKAPRPGRKLGHVTVVAQNATDFEPSVDRVCQLVSDCEL